MLWSLVVPSVFDLAGTTLAQTGLVYTTVSYFQLLRCTVIIVTAFLKVCAVGTMLSMHRWPEGKGYPHICPDGAGASSRIIFRRLRWYHRGRHSCCPTA